MPYNLKSFQDCLKDINLCLSMDYPIYLRPKVYFRKALCYLETGQEQNFEKWLIEISNFLSSSDVSDKSMYVTIIIIIIFSLLLNRINIPIPEHNI